MVYQVAKVNVSTCQDSTQIFSIHFMIEITNGSISERPEQEGFAFRIIITVETHRHVCHKGHVYEEEVGLAEELRITQISPNPTGSNYGKWLTSHI